MNIFIFREDKEEFQEIKKQSEYKPAVLFRKMLEAYKQQSAQSACK